MEYALQWEERFAKSKLGYGDFANVYEIWNHKLKRYVARKLYLVCGDANQKAVLGFVSKYNPDCKWISSVFLFCIKHIFETDC